MKESAIKFAKLVFQICGGWFSLMSGALSIPLAFVALFTDSHPKKYFAFLAFAALWVLAIRAVWKNYQLMETSKKELKAQKVICEKEKQQIVFEHIQQRQELENTIKSLRTPTVEIEGISCDIKSAQYHFCQLRVNNNSSTVTADNVRVELVSFEGAFETEEQSKYFRPVLPLVLSAAENSDYSINPGASLKFDLFRVTMNIKSAILNEGNVTGWRQTFTALFGKESTRDLAFFHGGKNFRVKFSVTARDFPKVEQEFNLIFTEEGSVSRFTLKKN